MAFIWFVVHIFLLKSVQSFHISSIGQTILRHPGESVVLTCDINGTDYVPHDNPLTWYKTQVDEVSPMVLLDEQYEPFTGVRFPEPQLSEEGEMYLSYPMIHDLIQEDNGNYTCKVEGLEETVTHTLWVVEATFQAELSFWITTDPTELTMPKQSPSSVTFEEDTAYFVACVVSSSVQMRLELVDSVSGQVYNLTHNEEHKASGDVKGLRKLQFISWRRSIKRPFPVSASLDQHGLRCRASIASTQELAKQITKHVTVMYKPFFNKTECHPHQHIHANKQTASTTIACIFRSNPEPSDASWKHMDTGEVDEAQFLLVGVHKYKTELEFTAVTADDYGVYRLTVGNDLGKTTYDIYFAPVSHNGSAVWGTAKPSTTTTPISQSTTPKLITPLKSVTFTSFLLIGMVTMLSISVLITIVLLRVKG